MRDSKLLANRRFPEIDNNKLSRKGESITFREDRISFGKLRIMDDHLKSVFKVNRRVFLLHYIV